MNNVILNPVHVDREREKAWFKQMIEGETKKHILLIQAEGGLGKTSLLREFWEAAQYFPRMQVTFKNSETGVTDILSSLSKRLTEQLGEIIFRRFARLEEGYNSNEYKISVDRTRIVFGRFTANLNPGEPDAETLAIRRRNLTDAFFQDLDEIHQAYPQVIMVQFDSFEKASDLVKRWLTEQFLTDIMSRRWIVTVVAGREVPQLDLNSEDWTLTSTLANFEMRDIREYVQRLELAVSEDVIEVFYLVSENGNPHKLRTFISTWLTRRGRANE